MGDEAHSVVSRWIKKKWPHSLAGAGDTDYLFSGESMIWSIHYYLDGLSVQDRRDPDKAASNYENQVRVLFSDPELFKKLAEAIRE